MSAYQMSHGLLAGSSTTWNNRVRVVFDKIDEDGNGCAKPDMDITVVTCDHE